MKMLPIERKALEAVRGYEPLSVDKMLELDSNQDTLDSYSRLQFAMTKLKWAAEEFERRELRLALYWQAVASMNRTEAQRERITALDRPTKRIRDDLKHYYRNLLKVMNETGLKLNKKQEDIDPNQMEMTL